MDELTAIEMNDVSLRHHENGNPLAGMGLDPLSPTGKAVAWFGDVQSFGLSKTIREWLYGPDEGIAFTEPAGQKAARQALYEKALAETVAAAAKPAVKTVSKTSTYGPKPATKTLFPDWVFVPGLLRTDSRTAAEGAVITDAQKTAKDASKVIANDIAAKIVEGSKDERANILDNGHVILDDRRKIPNWAPWAAVGGLGFLVLIMAVRR
jgi:hypothetical protein